MELNCQELHKRYDEDVLQDIDNTYNEIHEDLLFDSQLMWSIGELTHFVEASGREHVSQSHCREFTAQLDNDSRLSLLDTNDFAQIILEVYQEDKNFKVTDNFGEINIDDESAHTFSYSENNKETMVVALVHEKVPYVFKYQTLKENFDRDADIMLRFFSSVKFLDSAAIGNRQEITSEPKVSISPSYGPTNGFTITVNAYGFKPHTTVNWKLVNSDELIPLYGYFSTNNEGQLSDVIKLDDLEEDSYKIYFGEDVDNDAELILPPT